MKTSKILVLILFFATLSFGQESIKAVSIGRQVWMQANLYSPLFDNGDRIPVFADNQQLDALSASATPACGGVRNALELSGSVGKLYNWFAVSDTRGLCPNGFRVSHYEDFVQLLDYVYENLEEGESLEEALSINGSSGFKARYAGWCYVNFFARDGEVIDFANVGSNVAVWTNFPSEDYPGYALNLDFGSTWGFDTEGVCFDTSTEARAYSVRCIKK